jgi:hypothetical protein
MDIRNLAYKLNQIENNKLYEGLTLTEVKSVKLWENVGKLIKEAELTPDQIQQLFKSAEQGATDAGGNRTLLGKGKDAASAVNTAWEDLKTKIQNSAPIANVDSAYDSAVAKIETGLGGPDNAVNKIIQKYRAFAKEHPVAQGFIYAALIAAAGISGAGLGGAAVLGLLKMADKLLQGDKFSSAAYAGAKTGATAYAAGQIGQALKGTPQQELPGAQVASVGQAVGNPLRGAMNAGKDYIAQGGATDYSSLQTAADAYGQQLVAQGVGADRVNTLVDIFKTAAKGQATQALGGAAQSAMGGALQAATNESFTLSEEQIQTLFIRVDDTLILEGFMDKIKQFGKNLTTKITADKLNTAWTAAGSPTDSDAVSQVLQGAGVPAETVTKVFADLKLPTADTPAEPVSAEPTTLTTPEEPATPAAEPVAPVGMKAAEIVNALSTFWDQVKANQDSKSGAPAVQQQIKQMAKDAAMTGQVFESKYWNNK